MRDVQLCGWNDKRCLKHVCGRFNGLLERESRVSSGEGGLTDGWTVLVVVGVVVGVVVVVVVVVDKSRKKVASCTVVAGEKVEDVSQGLILKAEGDGQ